MLYNENSQYIHRLSAVPGVWALKSESDIEAYKRGIPFENVDFSPQPGLDTRSPLWKAHRTSVNSSTLGTILIPTVCLRWFRNKPVVVTAEIPGTLKTPDGTNFEGAFEASYGVCCTLLGALMKIILEVQLCHRASLIGRWDSGQAGSSGDPDRRDVRALAHFRLGRPALSPADNCRRESVASSLLTVYSRIPCLRTQKTTNASSLSLSVYLALIGRWPT